MLLTGKETTRVEFIESYIKHGAGDYEWNDNHGALVRCRDCKSYDGKGTCLKLEIGMIDDDWYCASGEKKDD